ncbi:MAG: hypothetical protein V1757_11220 [Actinomycetota bacterium]
MVDEERREKQDIAELARAAADAVAKLAVEVGRLVMDGVKSAWEAARRAADEERDADDRPAEDPGV